MLEGANLIMRSITIYSKKYGYYLLIGGIIAVITMYIWQHRTQIFTEGFQEGWNIASSTSLENAHGSAPAGVNALPGEPQYQQNASAPHVNPANKTGNPENTHPELKKQPLFKY